MIVDKTFAQAPFPLQLHAQMLAVFDAGIDISGTSNGPDGYRVHIIADEQGNYDPALDPTSQAVYNAHATLTLAADTAGIAADAADTATITYTDTFGDTLIDYEVWRNGAVYTQRQVVDISGDGQLVIELATATPGTYTIAVYRQAPNYDSGFIQVEAT